MRGETLSSTEVCEMSGLSYRQVHYWCSLGVLAPKVPGPPGVGGPGNPWRWDAEQVAAAMLLGRLLRAFDGRPGQTGGGLSVAVVRRVMEAAECPAGDALRVELGEGVALVVQPAGRAS